MQAGNPPLHLFRLTRFSISMFSSLIWRNRNQFFCSDQRVSHISKFSKQYKTIWRCIANEPKNKMTLSPKFATLPMDIVIHHILPYLVQPQSKELLQDIRSYVTDYNILHNVYLYEYNYSVLYYDLCSFCIGFSRPQPVFQKFRNIVTRHVLCKTDVAIIKTIRYIHDRSNSETDAQKIKFLWGLLTPTERTDFINQMIIEDYQEIHI